MADDILKNIPLPADLPENWTSGQIIAPTGAEAGLDDQHGYNYLMRQVNNAQKAAKELNKGKADSVVPHDLSIPITGWQTDTEVAEYPHYIDITADVTSTTVVSVSIDPASADVAGKAMLVNPETRTGAIRIRAHNIPTAEISARWYPIKYGGQFYGDGSIYSNFLLAAHPVGSIYQTISPENPAVTFGGGTWERIENRFIMGASDTYPAGSTGGSTAHEHEYKLGFMWRFGALVGYPTSAITTYNYKTQSWNDNNKKVNDGQYTLANDGFSSTYGEKPGGETYSVTGNTASSSSIPPYYSVYIWRRVA
jgi:hypothetical protein